MSALASMARDKSGLIVRIPSQAISACSVDRESNVHPRRQGCSHLFAKFPHRLKWFRAPKPDFTLNLQVNKKIGHLLVRYKNWGFCGSICLYKTHVWPKCTSLHHRVSSRVENTGSLPLHRLESSRGKHKQFFKCHSSLHLYKKKSKMLFSDLSFLDIIHTHLLLHTHPPKIAIAEVSVMSILSVYIFMTM